MQDLLDQLNLGEMPPKEDDVRQPSTEEIKHTITWLTDTLEIGKRARTQENSVEATREDPTRCVICLAWMIYRFYRDFPTDEHGFVNIGDA